MKKSISIGDTQQLTANEAEFRMAVLRRLADMEQQIVTLAGAMKVIGQSHLDVHRGTRMIQQRLADMKKEQDDADWWKHGTQRQPDIDIDDTFESGC